MEKLASLVFVVRPKDSPANCIEMDVSYGVADPQALRCLSTLSARLVSHAKLTDSHIYDRHGASRRRHAYAHVFIMRASTAGGEP